MYPFLGDFELGKTIFFPFETFNSSGASVTLTGLAVTDVEVFKGASMTQRSSDAGYALVDTDGIDLDGITGIHGFTIDTSDNTDAGFFAAGNDYTVVVASVTVDGQTCNKIVGRFSLSNRAGLKPTVEGRTLDVTAGGEAGIDLANISALPAGAIPSLGIIDNGAAQSATGTTLVLRAAAAFANDEIIGATIVITGGSAGVGQSRVITDYVSSTDTATVDTWTTTPTGTITYVIFNTPPASASSPPAVNVTQLGGDAQSATDLKDFADAGYDPSTNKVQGLVLADAVTTVNGLAANVITAAATAADFTTEIQSGLATAAALDAVDNFLDTEVAAILAAVDTEVAAILALLDNARGEPSQGAPPVNPDAVTKIDYLYKAFRNKLTQTATELSIFADDGTTVDHKATVSDSAGTFTRGELITGA